MNLRFVPIDQWPGTHTKGRRSSPFKGGYSSTVRLLERELAAIDARNVVIQLALLPGEIKNNGMPYADARPAHPGVILSFDRGKMPYSFPCDRFASWQENLRAIALAMDALRRVDRYGVTRNAEQYRGWAKLPPPGGLVTPPPMNVEDAAVFVANEGGPVPFRSMIDSLDHYRAAYRRAAGKLHPDPNGGKQLPGWATLQQAKQVLDQHHRL